MHGYMHAMVLCMHVFKLDLLYCIPMNTRVDPSFRLPIIQSLFPSPCFGYSIAHLS